MKKSLALAALVIGLGTSVFAATPAKDKAPKAKATVSFASLPADKGFSVSIDNPSAQKALVIVYDKDSNVIFKDVLSKGTEGEKGYIMNKLPEGDYTLEVGSKNDMVKKQIHVYDDGSGVKSYLFIQ